MSKPGRGGVALALALALPAIAAKWLNHVRPDLCPDAVHLTGGLALLAFVMARLLRFIVRAPRVVSVAATCCALISP